MNYIGFAEYDPAQNMSVDEELFRKGIPTFRVYGWKPAGISIGKFQSAEQFLHLDYCREDGVPVVRRMTGGSAIYHAEELTYSITASDADFGWENLSVKESYRRLNQFLIDFYAGLGLSAAYVCDTNLEIELSVQNGFCFSGRESYDLVIEGKKIGGNAQARKGRTFMQHGSIPLSVRPEKIRRYFIDPPDMTRFGALNHWLEQVPSVEDLAERLQRAFRDRFEK